MTKIVYVVIDTRYGDNLNLYGGSQNQPEGVV